jgi:hypothetical protein
MASTGAIERVSHGVYRMAGAPSQEHGAIYAAWLALGGAATPRTATTRDRDWPDHVPLLGETGLKTPTFAMTQQVRAIARIRIAAEAGRVDPACLDIACQWISLWLAIGTALP